jgi:hypothetical protein
MIEVLAATTAFELIWEGDSLQLGNLVRAIYVGLAMTWHDRQ